VFKTGNSNAIPFSYPIGLGPKPEVVYRAPQAAPQAAQREPSNSNWYPARYVRFFRRSTILANMHKPIISSRNSSYGAYDQRPRGMATYSIYPSGINDTYIYEQSTCSKSDLFSNSELDTASTTTLTPASAFSPALSSDSTQALQSTTFAERLLDNPRTNRPTTPTLNAGYTHTTAAPQTAPMTRTTSKNPQTKTELVDEHRSRVLSLPSRSSTPFRVPTAASIGPGAPMRISSGGLIEVPEYEGSTLSEIEVEKRDKIAKINAGLNSALTGSFYAPRASSEPSANQLNRVASSQPLHPNLHFPTRPLDPAHAPLPTSRSTYNDSPPKVERVPSQLPSDHPSTQAQAGTSSSVQQHPPQQISDSWSRDATVSSSHRAPSKTISDITEGGNVQPSRSGYTTYTSSQDGIGSQDRSLPADFLRQQRRSSVVGTRPEVAALRPSSEVRNGTPPRAASDSSHSTHSTQKDYNSRERRDGTRESPGRTSPHDPTRPSHTELETGRDVRTSTYRESEQARPIPPSRRNSFAPEPQRSPKDSRAQYSSGPLSSSPIQMRPFEEVIPGPAYQQPGGIPIANSDKSYNRVRTRSNSLSTSLRPTLPSQNPHSQSMQASPYDRNPFYEDEVASRHARMEAQNVHYIPSMNPYQPAPPTIVQLSSSAIDRTISSRPLTQEPSSNSRSRGVYPEQYIQQPPSQYPRAASYDIPAVNKYYDASGNVRTYIPSGTALSDPHPQRRYSDGDQNVSVKPPLVSRNSAPALRSVRWNENLICPSPVIASQRRKGWFNRRG